LENIADRISVFLLQFDRQEDIAYDGLRNDCPELFLPDHIDVHGVVDHLKMRLVGMLELTEGNRTLVAQKLGISRSTVWRWMKEQEVGNVPEQN